MDSKLDLLKADIAEKKRQGLLDNLLDEINLFNLKQDADEDDEYPDITTSLETEESSSLPPGIKFFNGYGNCSYTHDSIRPAGLEINGLNFEEITKVSHLENFDFLLRCEQAASDSSTKKKLFEYFFKFLFTQQTECTLDCISSILIEIANRTRNAKYLENSIVKILPDGIQNLGGKREVVFPYTPDANQSPQTETKNVENFDPLPNLNSVIKVMKYVIVREAKIWKDKLNISHADIDNLIFLLLVISQDSKVLYSSSLPSIQDLIAVLLDLYRSDAVYSEKVQDLVERVGCYWDDSSDVFNHHLACYFASNVLPQSRRGSHLRTSLSYYALMCCLLPNAAVDVLDFVLLPVLSAFCHNNVDAMKNATHSQFYSAIRLIDASIDWPVSEDRDKEEVKRILELLETVLLSKRSENDLYQEAKVAMLLNKVIKSEWERHLKSPEKKLKQTTITGLFKKNKYFDDYTESY